LIKYFYDYVKWQPKTFQDIIIFTGEAQNSTEACELVAHPIVTVGELEQKEKPMEKIRLWGTKPLKGTNGIHNGHNERLENCKQL
jgi:hypothetical protein